MASITNPNIKNVMGKLTIRNNSGFKSAGGLYRFNSGVHHNTNSLIIPENKQQMHHVLDEAFDLLGEYTILAHAKDIGPDNTFRAAGSGILDYDYYLHHLEAATVEVPLIIHGLSEAQVDTTVVFLRERIREGR